MRVASLIWKLPFELHEVQADVVRKLGHDHQFLWFNDPIDPETDVILVQGPYGTLAPLGQQLRALPTEKRPVLVYWFQQNLDFVLPNWVRGMLAPIFSDLCRVDGQAGLVGKVLERLAPRLINERGGRLRFFGDILWLHRNGLLDVLALTGTVYAEYLQRFGIRSVVVQRGYHAEYGETLDCERDIAVLWMGHTRSRRRRKLIYQLRDDLGKLGYKMNIHDGVSGGWIFGQERTETLNRARFVLNMLSHPDDELSIRYFLAAANGAVVLTEPGNNRYPFESGTHLVEAPVSQMAEIVDYYMHQEDERRQIADAMLHLMTTDLTLEHSIRTMLDLAMMRRVEKGQVSG